MDAIAMINWDRLIDGPIIPVTLTIGMITVVALTRTVASHWRQVRIAEADAMLKARMLERGFSAGEIERVIAAGSERVAQRPHRHDSSRPWKTAESCCA